MPRPIYHITHVRNLARIIESKGLWCDAERMRQGFASVGIAHENLKGRRARVFVQRQSGEAVAMGGTLADYVPFYFANRSPMLFSIHTGYVDGYDGGQQEVIYLLSSVERVASGNRSWCFTDGHAVEAVTEFFSDAGDLARIDWEAIQHWSWKNTEADPDRKRRKQAEFLVYQSLPWGWIEEIGVRDLKMRDRVSKIVRKAGPAHAPPIVVRRKWYY